MNRPVSKQARKILLPADGLELGPRTLIMGVVNVTPDSFSDGGLFYEEAQAVEQGLALAEAGADILDVGGESTRPGSEPTPANEEMDRVLPVIEALARHCSAVISVDTYKAQVARAAVEAGAQIINDITSLGGDPDMARTAAQTKAGLVLMHMKGEPRTMQADPTYGDVVAEVRDFLAQRAGKALEAGVAPEAIVLDPGIGFGKTLEHNLALIRNLGYLARLGHPVLLGASRKSFIGALTGRPTPGERLWGSVGVHVLGAALGADIVRVHDVAHLKEALAVCDAVMAQEEHHD
ncbi:MAG: dihydropteroate synthase [Proteobacteria bacterium]|nr:dihydropteroate synthase [Pseudomonadota bacterium]MBU1453047.1 dihydropteroate synthase [Pseudomonadota bacterium]MBU2470657.1 dihydropteroate synthase [Pseudomonadota bacterium]MBU2518900.1 dihydropteroate synthase [Pseudomonadota bacterium]